MLGEQGGFLPTASSRLGWWAAKTRREPNIKVQIVPVCSIFPIPHSQLF